ncbi:hypothetical protein C8Q80DRAFT_1271119 [Daedaleopsis nitida]|nr:hypothetical protein C8Q80DRAFT_1271119 [Daedaleopsis nitida]
MPSSLKLNRDRVTICAHHEINELQRVDGDVSGLYILGLICPISRVDLRTSIRSERDLEMLSEILMYARPKELKIDGYHAAWILYSSNSFSKLLRGAAGSRLENLVMRINLTPIVQKSDIAAALERLGATLRLCPLRRLRLCVRANMLEPPRASPVVPLNPAERSLQELDIVTFLCELEGATASLKDAVVWLKVFETPKGSLPSFPLERELVQQRRERWSGSCDGL